MILPQICGILFYMSEPTQPEQEKTPQEERLIPKNIIRPLARGLSQLFSNPTEEIRNQIPAVELEPNHAFQKRIEEMNPLLEQIEELLKKLQTAKEIKLAPKQKIIFSEETEDEIPPEGRIMVDDKLLDDKLLEDLLTALSHHIGTPLTSVIGYSEILRERSGSSEIRNRMALVNQAGEKILESFDPIRKATKLEITTDKAGSTTIIPSYKNLVE